jgi:14-3-3 protein epsilon
MAEREHFTYMAKLAEQAERYDEMSSWMAKVVETASSTLNPDEKELSKEERNLISVAFKNAIAARRASWRVVASIENREFANQSADTAALAASYRSKVEGELRTLADRIIALLDNQLLPFCRDPEAKVYYQKMRGDYFRYIAEIAAGEAKTTAAKEAADSYAEASNLADAELPVTHPIRLGLALNRSVFYFEILNVPEEACTVARQAFESAAAELDNVAEDAYKDSALILQLIRDNLTLWTSAAASAE